MKAAVIVLSNPRSGSGEALGRLFNALASVHDFKRSGDEVTLLFQGAGTRWVSEVSQPDHPAHGLFELVKDKVAGVSCGCADVFGADVDQSGFERISDNAVPGTTGLPSLRSLIQDGYVILPF